MIRLRRLTLKAGVDLYLKVGGVEAVRDIYDALEIGVDGIIAPMVESKFGAKKFYDSIERVYGSCGIHTTLNLETVNAIDNIDEILEYANNRFDNITIGRTDLSGSYFDTNINPNCEFIYNVLQDIADKIQNTNLTLTIGGGVSSDTLNSLRLKYHNLASMIYKLETRKVVFLTHLFLDMDNAMTEVLKFEELYILSKKEFSDLKIKTEIERLTELSRRL